jgi:hypothetical protein
MDISSIAIVPNLAERAKPPESISLLNPLPVFAKA